MTQFLFRRLFIFLPTILGAITVVFVLMRIVPGDVAVAILGEQAPKEAIVELRQRLGLDDPIAIQYLRFVTGFFRGDLGRSYTSGDPVQAELLRAFPATLELSLAAFVISLTLGLSIGLLAAVRRDSLFDTVTTVGVLVGVSMPVFWLALVLIGLFSVELRWLPVSGRVDVRLDYQATSGFVLIESLVSGNLAAFQSALRHLMLPALALAAVPTAYVARVTRSSLLEEIGRDYVRTARSKGVSQRAAIVGHALKNAMIPIVTTVGIKVGYMLNGAVLTETIFSWPGVGKLMVNALTARDLPMVQGAILWSTMVFLVVNLLVDIAYAVVNPRIRYS